MMETLLKRAERKAVAELRKSIQSSFEKGLILDSKEQSLWKERYMLYLFSVALNLANRQAMDKIVYLLKPREAIAEILEERYRIPVIHNGSSTTITLANNSYVFNESGYVLRVGYQNLGEVTLLSPDDNINLLLAFDKYIASMDEKIQKEQMNFMTKQKSSDILTAAANVILKDILEREKDVSFTMKAQKNGFFRCRVMELAPWMPAKTIRTDLTHLREDFMDALKEIREKREGRYGTQ